MARGDPQYVLCYPEELRQRVAASAKANGRSINAEICFQLQEAYTIADWEVAERKYPQALKALKLAVNADIDRMDSMAGNS